MKNTLLAAAVALTFSAPGVAGEYFVVVPNQGKDDFTHLTDVMLTPLALPSGKVGEPYAGFNFNSVLSVTGDPNFTSEQVVWSVVSGQLPEGLTLNADGTLTGNPTLGTTAEGQGFTIRAAYLSKNDTELYRVTVKVAIALAGATLPEGIVGQPYPGVDLKPLVEVDGDAGFTANAVTWRLADGHALPAGLTLNANGTITGTPSAAFTGDVRVVASYQDEAASQQYRFVTLALNVALANATAPQGIVGQPYAGFDLRDYLTVTGDPAFDVNAVSWSLAEGAQLPAGLSLNADGTVSGTPTEAVTQPVTFRAAYRGVSGQQSYSLVTLNIGVSLATATAPQGIVGQAYAGFNLRDYLTVSGDASFNSGSAVTWSVASGTLPAGLTLNTSTGEVSGTPTAAASSTVTFRATYRGVSGQQSYSLVTLNIELSLASATLPEGKSGNAYSYDFKNLLSATGDASFAANKASFSLSGSLPSGLSLSSAGVLAGTPGTTTAGQNFTVNASYRGVSASRAYNITVTSASFTFNPTISSNTNNYNLRNEATAAGWDGKGPLLATVTVSSGVIVGSSDASAPAFSTGGSMPAGSNLVLLNYGRIAGATGKGGAGGTNHFSSYPPLNGGDGGVGLSADDPLEVKNYGTIAGGGGGGGGGAYGGFISFTLKGTTCVANNSGAYGGGGGGGGAGTGQLSDKGASGGMGFQGNGSAGGGGTLLAGGGGGAAGHAYAGKGGSAGAPGVAGSAGGNGAVYYQGSCNNKTFTYTGAQGGAAGPAATGDHKITWTISGTRLGPLQ